MKILLFLFLCAASLCAQQSTLDRIRDLQDQRIEQSAELYGYLQSPDEKIRSRALIAIANIQDTNAIAIVVPLLKDPKPMVRRDAAFCLGMIGKQSAARQLFDQFSVEKDSMAIDEIAQSIGKCGDRSDLARLLGMSGRLNSLQYEAIPLSCARFAIRGIATDSMYRLLTSMIGQGRSAYWSTYALMRMNDSVIAKNFSEVLLPGLSSSSPEIVMWTELILGNSTDPAVKKRIAALTSDKYDWRIRINAERALSNTRTQEIVDLFKTLIDDSNEHVSLTAITTFNALLSDSDFIKQHSLFEKIVNDSVRYSFRQRAEAALILGKRTGEYSLAILARHLNTDDRLTPYLLKAMGETRSSRALPVIALYFQSSNSTIEMAAVSAYQNIVRLLDQREKEKFLSAVIPFFSRSDPGLSLTVASVFEDTAFSIDTRKQYMRQLLLAFNTMESVNDVEPMQELLDVFGVLKDSSALESVANILHADESSLRHNAARAYESITGREYIPQGPKRSSYTPLFAPEDFKLLRNFSGADIRTNRGTIRIMFRPDAAPFTTLSFIKLVQKNFYRGLTFHRVVSNFVIQGGDPLGNGSGGPGYTLRTEVSPDERYSEGAVGLASAGKDTEGSQFFITHCPTPHLDGRYTIFAYTKDQQVVDTIMVGDVINGIQLLDAQGNLK